MALDSITAIRVLIAASLQDNSLVQTASQELLHAAEVLAIRGLVECRPLGLNTSVYVCETGVALGCCSYDAAVAVAVAAAADAAALAVLLPIAKPRR
jgi:hypothetical protein